MTSVVHLRFVIFILQLLRLNIPPLYYYDLSLICYLLYTPLSSVKFLKLCRPVVTQSSSQFCKNSSVSCPHLWPCPSPVPPSVRLACVCHTFHYVKRLVETIFVHRFSHGTMPLRTIVKVRKGLGWWAHVFHSAWPLFRPPHPHHMPAVFTVYL